MFIPILAIQQRDHVNFTTDMNIAEPVIHQAGQDFKIVMAVSAYPSISSVDLYWEKNGEILESDGHYHITNTSNTVTLEIHQLYRTDAATYTLYGKTKDGIDSISFLLEIQGKLKLNGNFSVVAIIGKFDFFIKTAKCIFARRKISK